MSKIHKTETQPKRCATGLEVITAVIVAILVVWAFVKHVGDAATTIHSEAVVAAFPNAWPAHPTIPTNDDDPQAAMAADTPSVAPGNSPPWPSYTDAAPLYELCRDAVARRWVLNSDRHAKCLFDCLNYKGALRGDCLDGCDAAVPSDADIELDMCRYLKWGWPQSQPDETDVSPPSPPAPTPRPYYYFDPSPTGTPLLIRNPDFN